MGQRMEVAHAWEALGGVVVGSHVEIAGGKRWVTVADSGVELGLEWIQVAVLLVVESSQLMHILLLPANAYPKLPEFERCLVVLP